MNKIREQLYELCIKLDSIAHKTFDLELPNIVKELKTILFSSETLIGNKKAIKQKLAVVEKRLTDYPIKDCTIFETNLKVQKIISNEVLKKEDSNIKDFIIEEVKTNFVENLEAE